MASQSAKEIVDELNKHGAEASKLRNALNLLDNEKERWFKKSKECSISIRNAIQKIKDCKEKRDSLTQEVRELKTKRDGINRDIASKVKDLGSLKKEKAAASKSSDIKETPSKIKQGIERLEFKIETEPMPFDKEQDLMKRIKELKKLHENASCIAEFDEKIRDGSEAIKKMGKEANEAHKSMQEKAKQSQALHEEILNLSLEIGKMKADEEDAFKKFSEFKKKFNEANAQLKEELKAMNGAKASLDKISHDRKEKRRLEQESFLKSKEEEISQKIKRGEKLTTEDLLVFQKLAE